MLININRDWKNMIKRFQLINPTYLIIHSMVVFAQSNLAYGSFVPAFSVELEYYNKKSRENIINI